MKKTSTKFFTLVALSALAFGFTACSNSSDGGAALPSLVTTTTNGGTSGAPNSDNTGGQPNGGSGGASAEANIFAGKTFSRKDTGGSIQTYTCKFDAQKCTFTRLVDFNIPGASTTAPATEHVYNYEYSYNKEKRLLFLKPSAEGHYKAHVKNGVRTIEPDAFSNDAEFVAFVKKIYDTDDAQIINSNRSTFFNQYGYSVNTGTGATEVSNEVLEKYKAAKLEEKARSAKLCTTMAYELSGQTLKMAQDSRVPKGKNLNEIFGVYNVQLPIASSNYRLRYSINYYTKGPDIVEINNLSGTTNYKVDSITENAINISATATNSMNISAVTGVWTYTPASQSFSYTTSKTETGATFTIDTLGTITVTYESENNFPDLTANFLDGEFGGTFTQQQ